MTAVRAQIALARQFEEGAVIQRAQHGIGVRHRFTVMVVVSFIRRPWLSYPVFGALPTPAAQLRTSVQEPLFGPSGLL